MDRRKIWIGVLVLVVLGMVGFSALRYLVTEDISRGGLEFEGRLAQKGNEAVVHIKVRSTLFEKGDVRLVDARLDGIEPVGSIPLELGEIGPWKDFELRFPGVKGTGPHKLEVTARFKTLFSDGAVHREIELAP